MSKESSTELPVAIGVYITSNNDGSYHIRAADHQKQTLIFDPFYSKAVRKFKDQEPSVNLIKAGLIKSADIVQLADIADLLDEQQQISFTIASKFAEFHDEKYLPVEIVQRFFRSVAKTYGKIAFAEQLLRLKKLKDVSGSQLDLLWALKKHNNTDLEKVYDAYERVYRVSNDFANVAAEASEIYDANVKKFYGATPPDNLTKFGKEPEVLGEKQGFSFSELEVSLHKIATDPILAASVERRRREALDSIKTLADRIRQATS